MVKQKLFLKDGTLFASEFERVVHGGRGDYIELTQEQIRLPLQSKFGNSNWNEEISSDFYYYWLYPIGYPNVKVYKQCKIVKYADYKIGYFYISPSLLLNFKDPENLF